MTLAPGNKLGHYEITSQLGKGGMGEVYQAKDLKLGRDVAIKVLPEEFAKDPDRVARFQREAKLLASLNHPNIAAIYGLEESGGTNFLVLELVEGETLADRIKQGPIPVEDSLKLALQITEALEAAHEKGVIHRDLKPANIKVTPDGKVKVLDFGLAKAFAGEQDQMNVSNSPTLSVAATQQGIILGTAAYMSPEQAKGKAVDRRTDVWAFGCVLFEMLTGRSLFSAEDVSQTLARVLERQPDFSMLPQNINPGVAELLRRCLQKDAKNRFHDIADVRLETQDILGHPGGVYAQPVGARGQMSLKPVLLWALAAFVFGAVIAGWAIWFFRPTPTRKITQFSVELAGQPNDGNSTALSPDGRRIVYPANGRLYQHSLDQMEPAPIPGTEGGYDPFFSPDGKAVAFFTSKQLKSVSLSGLAPVVLAAVNYGKGGAWDAQNRIFFGQDGRFGLSQVPAGGGTPKKFAELGDHVDLEYPDVLPGGEWVLFTDLVNSSNWNAANIVAQSVATGERKIVLKGGYFARYSPTGHLVYVQNGMLFAIGFDPERIKTTGTGVPVVQNVASANTGWVQYGLAKDGTLIYTKGMGIDWDRRALVWVDRKGQETPITAQPNAYANPRISPDGTRVALGIGASANEDIWIWDLGRETLTRLTLDAAPDYAPLWSPNGQRIAFGSLRKGEPGIYWQAVDGTGEAEFLGSANRQTSYPSSWSRDGKTLVLEATDESNFGDIGTLAMEGSHIWKPLLQREFVETNPHVSCDGRWIAYFSEESGKWEIYVRPFPDVDKGKWLVSTSGGSEPRWSQNGRELFYRNNDAMMAVEVETEPTFRAGRPKTLFKGNYYSYQGHNWDLSSDGKRFLMIKPFQPAGSAASPEAKRPKINVVLNWIDELKQLVPAK